MGILDSKNRVIDTIITQEGRRQMVSGKMKVEFATFTDTDTFYEADLLSGSTDATARIYFETTNLPQDQITFESDDSGKLMPFKAGNGLGVLAGKVLSSSVPGFTNKVLHAVTSPTLFFDLSSRLLSSSIENFTKVRAVGTINTIFDDEAFSASESSINFQVTDQRPFSVSEPATVNVNHLERFMEDARLSHLPNFKYLPPVNKVQGKGARALQSKHIKLGVYKKVGWDEKLTQRAIQKQLRWSEKNGFSKTIKFDPTSHANRLMAQFFEVQSDTLVKMDVIDFGKINDPVKKNASNHVFFVGKIVEDNLGTHTFVHVFTMVFE